MCFTEERLPVFPIPPSNAVVCCYLLIYFFLCGEERYLENIFLKIPCGDQRYPIHIKELNFLLEKGCLPIKKIPELHVEEENNFVLILPSFIYI